MNIYLTALGIMLFVGLTVPWWNHTTLPNAPMGITVALMMGYMFIFIEKSLEHKDEE